ARARAGRRAGGTEVAPHVPAVVQVVHAEHVVVGGENGARREREPPVARPGLAPPGRAASPYAASPDPAAPHAASPDPATPHSARHPAQPPGWTRPVS